jgi:hypothetical protein
MICTAVEQVVGDETWRSIELFKHITLDMEEKRNITKDLPSVQSYVDYTLEHSDYVITTKYYLI